MDFLLFGVPCFYNDNLYTEFILNICKIRSLYSKYRRGQKYIQIDKERTLQAREKTNKSGYTCTSI